MNEITAVCPDITNIPGSFSMFGLLQALQYYGDDGMPALHCFMNCVVRILLDHMALYCVS